MRLDVDNQAATSLGQGLKLMMAKVWLNKNTDVKKQMVVSVVHRHAQRSIDGLHDLSKGDFCKSKKAIAKNLIARLGCGKALALHDIG